MPTATTVRPSRMTTSHTMPRANVGSSSTSVCRFLISVRASVQTLSGAGGIAGTAMPTYSSRNDASVRTPASAVFQTRICMRQKVRATKPTNINMPQCFHWHISTAPSAVNVSLGNRAESLSQAQLKSHSTGAGVRDTSVQNT